MIGENIRTPMGCFFSLAAAAMVVLAGCDQSNPRKPVSQSAEVTAIVLAPTDVPITPSFVAQARSSHDVEIIARVSGFLDKIVYREGQKVQAGDILFQIDGKPFQAQLDSISAQMESLKADWWTAKANLDRIKPLARQNAASKSELDNATGKFMAAEAALAEVRARLQKAELDLGYTTIKSPIAGIAGQAMVREGTYLAAGGLESKLTRIVRLDPIWVEFSVTQNQFAKMQDEIASGLVVSPPASEYVIEIEFADGKKYPHTGRFTFADRTFNVQTGTFLVRVEVPNPDEVLLPGMFVKALIRGAVRPNAIRVPQKAVQQTADGHIVYIANDQNLSEIRPVVVGEWAGRDWIITRGLNPGERVIVGGFQRLAPGVPVIVKLAETTAQPADAAGTR